MANSLHKSGLLFSPIRFSKLLQAEMQYLSNNNNIPSQNNYIITLIEYMISSLEADLTFAKLEVIDYDYNLISHSPGPIKITRTTEKEYTLREDQFISDRTNIKQLMQIGMSYITHLESLISQEKILLESKMNDKLKAVMFKLIISPNMGTNYAAMDVQFKFTNIHYFIKDNDTVLCNGELDGNF